MIIGNVLFDHMFHRSGLTRGISHWGSAGDNNGYSDRYVPAVYGLPHVGHSADICFHILVHVHAVRGGRVPRS